MGDKRRSRRRATAVALALAAALAVLAGVSAATQAEGLQVLHWWKSASERRAVDLVAARLNEENVVWRDSVIPNGSGVGAGIVLRSRILAGNAPEVAQVNGIVIRDWARLSLLLDLDQVAAAGQWEQKLQPTVNAVIRADGHVYAAPIGIHRINTLFYNRRLFNRYKLAPPDSWAQFEHAATVLQKAGIVPLAQSSEPWQVGTLFETLVLAEGADFYRALFQRREAAAYADPRLAAALTHLRYLKRWMSHPILERTWDQTTIELSSGRAAMQVMGDWAKGELNEHGMVTGVDFGCGVVPGTAGYHLYNIDTLSMLATRDSHRPPQEKLAALIMSPGIQSDYNQIKGSIPVLRQPQLSKMDSCQLASFKLFSSGPQAQIPSLVHRMATDEIVRDAMVEELHRYFLNDQLPVAEMQRRLGTIARTFTKTP